MGFVILVLSALVVFCSFWAGYHYAFVKRFKIASVEENIMCIRCGDHDGLETITYATIDKRIVNSYLVCTKCGLDNKIFPIDHSKVLKSHGVTNG